MAHPSEIDRQITLELEPINRNEGVPIEAFRKATKHFTALLKHLTAFQGSKDKWQIYTKPGCLLIGGQYCGDDVTEEELLDPLQVLDTEIPKSDSSNSFVTSETNKETQTLQHNLQEPVEHYSTLYSFLGRRTFRDLKSLADIKECHVSLWLNKKPYNLSANSHLFSVPPEDVYTSNESVRGTLVNISSKSNKCQITIYSPAFDVDVKGNIEETSKLMAQAKKLLGNYVEVSGLITYEDVYPKKIEVSDISDLATSPEEQLRVIREAAGILKGYVSLDELE